MSACCMLCSESVLLAKEALFNVASDQSAQIADATSGARGNTTWTSSEQPNSRQVSVLTVLVCTASFHGHYVAPGLAVQ